MQTSKYSEEVHRLLATIDEPEKDSQEQSPPDATQPLREIDIYIEDDRITFIPKTNQQEQVIDSLASEAKPAATPLTDQEQKPEPEAIPPLNGKVRARNVILTVSFYMFLILSTLLLQSSLPFYSPTATVTIIPKSQEITLTGTLQLGRIVAPITLIQSQTVPTTGKRHQDARSAIGYITFYNGLFTSQTVQAGTVLTGNGGVQIKTDQSAYISEASPPSLGYAIVSAHAIHSGSNGNIPAYDINQACCTTAIKAVNTTSFHGGQDERDFSIVRQEDINNVSTSLKTTLSQSMQAALEAQLQSGEALVTPTCTPTTNTDHKVGEEATQVTVTASETCSAVAYNSQELKGKVTDLLTHLAVQTLGTGYSLLGEVQVTVHQATKASTTKPVVLSFSAIGTWVYALTTQEQRHIKELIAGKTKRNALQLLASLPGIQSASIAWNERTNLPNDPNNIHVMLIYGL